MGTTQQDFVEENVKYSDIQILSKVTKLVLELKTEKIDALVTEAPVVSSAIKNAGKTGTHNTGSEVKVTKHISQTASPSNLFEIKFNGSSVPSNIPIRKQCGKKVNKLGVGHKWYTH